MGRCDWVNLARVACLLLAVSWCVRARGEETAAEAEIRAAAASYLEALHQGDAAKIADFWTDDGVYIDGEGHSFSAKTLAKEEFAKAGTAGEQAPAVVKSSIRFVAPSVAIEQSANELPAGAGSGFLAAWVMQN